MCGVTSILNALYVNDLTHLKALRFQILYHHRLSFLPHSVQLSTPKGIYPHFPSSMFVVVGSKEPLYKMEMRARREDSAHVDEFVLHAALDLVDELVWTTPNMALKVVDRFNDQLVSAFVTASGVRFLLLHETRSDETIKGFFQEVHELYIKVREKKKQRSSSRSEVPKWWINVEDMS